MQDALGQNALARVASQLARLDQKTWFYGDSIGMEGLAAASALLEDQRWTYFVWGVAKAWAARRRPFQAHDNTAPGHAMCGIVEQTGDQTLLAALVDLAQHLDDRPRLRGVAVTFPDARDCLREPYGGAALSAVDRTVMERPGAGIYVDCMHFDAPFYAHLSRHDASRDWARTAVHEILAYRDLLRNERTGLYRHFWLEALDEPRIEGWGRGQGWAVLGLLDTAQCLDEKTPGHDAVVDAFTDLCRRMLPWQEADGNWHALVEEPRSGPESSTAAFMATAYYRGMAAGYLSADEFLEPAERAYAAMKRHIRADGMLTGVSAAVYSALCEEHYWHVPIDNLVPWGQGPVLTAASARHMLHSKMRA